MLLMLLTAAVLQPKLGFLILPIVTKKRFSSLIISYNVVFIGHHARDNAEKEQQELSDSYFNLHA